MHLTEGISFARIACVLCINVCMRLCSHILPELLTNNDTIAKEGERERKSTICIINILNATIGSTVLFFSKNHFCQCSIPHRLFSKVLQKESNFTACDSIPNNA